MSDSGGRNDMRYSILVRAPERGWPWPGDSWGKDPLFGVGGWCLQCGVPFSPQTGSLVIERAGINAAARSAWFPHWNFDTLCLPEALAERVKDGFDVELRPIMYPRGKPSGLWQLLPQVTAENWWDPDELTKVVADLHSGQAGEQCVRCQRWRWGPASTEQLPPVHSAALRGDAPAIVSPEWFGTGVTCYRNLLLQQELADLIVSLGGSRSYEARPVRIAE